AFLEEPRAALPTAPLAAHPRSSLPASALHTEDLLECVDDLDEVALRGHHGVDVLVRHGRLVDHALVLAALDALGRGDVISEREALLGLGPRHDASRTVTAATEALGGALPSDDVRARAHAARDDAEL